MSSQTLNVQLANGSTFWLVGDFKLVTNIRYDNTKPRYIFDIIFDDGIEGTSIALTQLLSPAVFQQRADDGSLVREVVWTYDEKTDDVTMIQRRYST